MKRRHSGTAGGSITFSFEADSQPGFFNDFAKEFTKQNVPSINFLLDIGCFTGGFLSLLHEAQSIGVDIMAEPIRKVAKVTCPYSGFVVASADSLPLQVETFDTVTLWDVIEHLPTGRENKLVVEVSRIVKAGGRVLISTPNRHPIAILLDPAFFLRRHKHYSVTYLTELFKRNGFHIEVVALKAGPIVLLTMIISYFFKHVAHHPISRLQKFLGAKAREEYRRNDGFASIMIVARKKRSSEA